MKISLPQDHMLLFPTEDKNNQNHHIAIEIDFIGGERLLLNVLCHFDTPRRHQSNVV